MPAPQLPDDQRIEHDLRPRFREKDFDELHRLSAMTKTPVNVLVRRMALRSLRDAQDNLGSAYNSAMPNRDLDVYSDYCCTSH